MPMPSDDDHRRANESQDEAVATLVAAVLSEPQEPQSPRYSEAVYKAAWKLVDACNVVQANYDYRITDLEEYKVEVERRQQIGLTIDPATAETTFWWADAGDPYHLLDEGSHLGCVGRVRLARNPGASDWVAFSDLPEATSKALLERDGRKLVFPYGLDPSHDVINYPATMQDEKAEESHRLDNK
jgi:hypothetical protein